MRIMEEARINGLKKEEEREMRRREVNFLAAQALNKQIEEQQVLREHKFIEKRKVREQKGEKLKYTYLSHKFTGPVNVLLLHSIVGIHELYYHICGFSLCGIVLIL